MNKLLSKFGPGFIYAGAAVGVSHLIQSTKAGSLYGFQLILFIILANVIKYPFFKIGSHYTLATKEHILVGYRKLGKWAVGLFLGSTFLTMFTIQAAVTIVTSSIIKELFNININFILINIIVLLSTIIILLFGKYKTLDNIMKYIIIMLSIVTILSVVFAFKNSNYFIHETINPFEFNGKHLTFLIALIGWMPAPFDITVWQSIWTKEKITSNSIDIKTGSLDFNIGYWSTMVLAILFLSLGALTLNGNIHEIPSKGTEFISLLIKMYTLSIGQWSYYLIGFAALATMFSTTITCLDAFPRVITPSFELLTDKKFNPNKSYFIWISITAIGAIVWISAMNMGQMIQVATVLSFFTAPIIAWLNLKAIEHNSIPTEYKFSKRFISISYIFLALIIAFTLYYGLTLF